MWGPTEELIDHLRRLTELLKKVSKISVRTLENAKREEVFLTMMMSFLWRILLALAKFARRLFAVHKFPQYWEFFRYLLPKRVQDAAWEPTFWELMDDYYSVIGRLEGRKWRTRWIVFCFSIRTILMYVQCLRAFAADATIGWAWRTLTSIFRPRS